jgi:hypothetical protein
MTNEYPNLDACAQPDRPALTEDEGAAIFGRALA